MCCNGKLRLNTIKNLNFLKFVIRKHWDQDSFFQPNSWHLITTPTEYAYEMDSSLGFL